MARDPLCSLWLGFDFFAIDAKAITTGDTGEGQGSEELLGFTTGRAVADCYNLAAESLDHVTDRAGGRCGLTL